MEKFPFNATGFQDLQTQLFALPDNQLQEQADAIGNDLRGFTAAHFVLSESQLAFLAAIDETFIDHAAAQTKEFIENRKVVGLIKEPTPASRGTEGEDRGKILDLDKKATNSYSREHGFQYSESLDYVITYPIHS